jgi:hypothetical protein
MPVLDSTGLKYVLTDFNKIQQYLEQVWTKF